MGPTRRASIKRPAPTAFGRAIRGLHPGCECAAPALADWHRRMALSLLPRLGLEVGTPASIQYIRDAGL